MKQRYNLLRRDPRPWFDLPPREVGSMPARDIERLSAALAPRFPSEHPGRRLLAAEMDRRRLALHREVHSLSRVWGVPGHFHRAERSTLWRGRRYRNRPGEYEVYPEVTDGALRAIAESA